MNYPRDLRCTVFAVFGALWATAAHAQSTTQTLGSSAPDVNTKDAIIELSPFTVNSKKDVGFVASSALAGGRLATDLKDTPAAYSVLTREFIDALNLTDLTAAIKWTVNTNNINDDGRGTMFADEQSTKLSIRGATSNQQQIDFFPVYYDYDSYNLERFDFARGPNSILFGNGSFGGTPNATVKRARTDSAFREMRATYSSWGNERVTFDVNQPVNQKLAVRLNVLWQDAGTWRDREFNKKMAAAASVTYSPFNNTQIRASVDYGRFDRNIALATLGDRISGWDGTSTFSVPLTTLPSDANARGITRNGSSTAPYLVYNPATPGAGLVNWANSAVTLGGNANGAVPVGGTLVTGPGANYAGGPILDTVNLPGNAFNLATSGSQFRVPGRSFTASTSDRSFRQDYQTYTLSIDQRIGQHVFLNASGNYTSGEKTTDYTVVRGLNDVYLDINRNLPTGAPNPNFLVPYHEAIRFKNLTNFSAHNYRGSAAFVFDKTNLGDFRLNLEVGNNRFTTPRVQYVYTVKDPTLDSRDWPTNNNVRYRYYWNTFERPENDIGSVTLTDPISGTTRTVQTGFVIDSQRQNNTSRTVADFKYGQAALNWKLFDEKLNLLAAIRRDDYTSAADQSTFRRGYAAGWDGSYFTYRPRPPADYFTLKYIPKNAGGTPTGVTTTATARPRDGNGNPLPQYAGDRFQDDFSTPQVQGALTTYSGGGVFHATDWVSILANYAETYNPPSPAIRINAGVFSPLLSQGWDAGLRFSAMKDRFVLTLTKYSGKQENVAVGTGTGDGLAFGLSGLFNNIIDANVIGDQSASGTNARGLQQVPFVYSDKASRRSKGTEIEFVANPIPGWRVLANLAFPEATQSDAYGDTRAYIAANESTLRQILGDAGVTISASNVASVDQSVPVNQQSPDASAAATAWNNLQSTKANFVTASQKLTRLGEVSGNVFSDYTIRGGALKGFRFGGGVNYRGREVIGFRGADTIVNPANPSAAIDDPSVDALTPVYRSSYYTATAVFGYVLKLKQKYTVGLDFTIDNLLDQDRPLYYNTVQRPAGGNLSTPARIATPNQYSYLVPRSYSLSATLKF